MYIYKTRNKINGKIYIGKSEKLYEKSIMYLGSGIKLLHAIKKYGKISFEKELLCTCSSISELNEKEKYYIAFYNSTNDNIGYNIAPGGEGGDLYTNHPDYINLIENKKGAKNSFFGKHHTTESKQKISQKKLGRKRSVLSVEKMKRTMKRQFKEGLRKINVTEQMKRDASKRLRENNPSKKEENRLKHSLRMHKNNPTNSENVRKKLRESKLGEKNPNANIWILKHTDGTVHIIKGSIITFCLEHNISPEIMWNIARGKRKQTWEKGWTCERDK
ncbi:MAG: GIY-YIG nuclease family protein [Eubacteriales bacterium]|nr:GIY-YIG nuclease family protein [Eubacteriales bacterium]